MYFIEEFGKLHFLQSYDIVNAKNMLNFKQGWIYYFTKNYKNQHKDCC